MKRLTALLLALLVMLPSVAWAAGNEVMIQDIMLDEYPRVSMRLGLPGADAESPEFRVTENGKRVEILEAAEVEADPVDVILVMDSSGSMQGESLDVAKRAATTFVGEMSNGSKVGMITFADRARVLTPISESSAALITPAVGTIQASGETALYDALVLAASEAERAGVSRPVVVLLSDGGDTVSRAKLDDALKRLKAAGAPVLVVALPSAEADHAVLRTIADQTGGRFSSLKRADMLVEFYTSLARQLQTEWDVTFVSRRPSTMELDIVVESQRAGGAASKGAVAVANPLYAGQAPDQGRALEPVPPASMLTLAMAALLAFGAVFALIVAIALIAMPNKTALEHLRYYDQLQSSSPDDGAGDDYGSRITTSLMGAVDYVAGRRGVKRYLYEQLERAGLPLRPTEYITIHVLMVVALGALVEVLAHNFWISALVVAVAAMVPLAFLDMRIRSRRIKFEEQMPDVLNLVAGSLRAGWGLQQSVDLVVEQMPAPVSEEFARAQTEIRLGRPVEEALSSVARRTASGDFTWVVTAIGIQREVGGNLAEVLDMVAATLRDRAALNRQIRSLTAEGRLSAWVLLILPFVILGVTSLTNRGYLSALFQTTPGLVMLVLGAVLLVIGAFWLRRIVVIEV